MTASKAQIKASAKYRDKTYSRIPLDVRKEYHEYVKIKAKEFGMSVNGFIKQAIDEKCEGVKDELPQELIPNLMKWLEEHGHSESDIVDCISHLSDKA